jgi:protein SCO1/2
MSQFVECRRAVKGMVFTLLLLLTGISSALAHSLNELENQLRERERYIEIVNRKAPDFALLDAKGIDVGLSDFRGKVVVLNFIYTNCPDICPLHSQTIAAIQKAINPTPMKNLVQFISITTDPLRDTSVVMQNLGSNHGLDPVNWVFLTSGVNRPDETRKIARQYGARFTPSKSGYQMHGIVTYIIDKSGKLRAKFHGLKFDKTNMIIHINALTNDNH